MTTITINRATVEQALEALELGHDTAKAEADRYHVAMAGFRPERHAQMDAEVQQIAAAITAMRAALAQQAEPAGTRALIEECLAAFAQELAAWDIDPPLHHVKQAHDKCEAWLAAPPQQAEPVAPVAEARYDGTLRWLEPHGVGLHRIQGPLYTAPPHRKPLTDEEIVRIRMSLPHFVPSPDQRPYEWAIRYARAVERAHGITDPQVADRLARHGIPMPGDPK